jgi:hypothetical protein
MSKNKNCHVKIIESEAGGFRRKNIQAVANALFFHLKFTTINVCNLNKNDQMSNLMTKININEIKYLGNQEKNSILFQKGHYFMIIEKLKN